MFVVMNSCGPSIERSTWLSAARCITASGWKLFENLSHGRGIRNVGLHEMISRIVAGPWNRSRIGGIGQLIDVEDFMIGFRQQETKKSRADETIAAGDGNSFLRRHDQATCVSGAMLAGKSSGAICGKPIKYCP